MLRLNRILRGIAFTGIIILVGTAHARGLGEQTLCSETRYEVPIRPNVTAHVGFFETVAPQGAVVFVLGSHRNYDESLPFIRQFCHHGFSVAAFDLSGLHVTGRDYVFTASKIATRLRATRPKLPLLAYGWAQGASVAVQAVSRQPKLFSKLVLENPQLDRRDFARIHAFPSRMTRVFACKSDFGRGRGRGRRWTRLARHAAFYVPAHHSDCSHHLSALPDAQGPMLDFIESDFAGVQSSNWYLKRIL